MKFVLDNGGSYSFAVRGKDDHVAAETKGITYDIFVSTYQLPVPKSVRLPGENSHDGSCTDSRRHRGRCPRGTG